MDDLGGISLMEFSHNDRFIALQLKTAPRAVWIYQIGKESPLAVLVHRQAVSSISWNSSKSELAICTASQFLYVWTPKKMSSAHVVDVPYGMPFQHFVILVNLPFS
jgi:hypothetical protein